MKKGMKNPAPPTECVCCIQILTLTENHKFHSSIQHEKQQEFHWQLNCRYLGFVALIWRPIVRHPHRLHSMHFPAIGMCNIYSTNPTNFTFCIRFDFCIHTSQLTRFACASILPWDAYLKAIIRFVLWNPWIAIYPTVRVPHKIHCRNRNNT